MNHEITIRPEASTDNGAKTEVTVNAFENLEISNHTEQFIIEALRAAKALTWFSPKNLDQFSGGRSKVMHPFSLQTSRDKAFSHNPGICCG